MLKWTAICVGLLIPLAWLAGSVFVALVEPGGLKDTTLALETTEEGRPRWRLAHPPPRAARDADSGDGSAHIPLTARGSATSDPGGPEEFGHEHFLVRGALEPGHGTFPLAVGLLFESWEPVREVRLEVTLDRDWGQAATLGEVDWIVLGAADTVADGRWQWVSIEGNAPAGTVAWQYAVTEADGGAWSTGQTLGRPRGRLDRLLEDLSAYGIFRWLATDESTE